MAREWAISLDNLRTVPKVLPVEPITRLGPAKLGDLCAALVAATNCD